MPRISLRGVVFEHGGDGPFPIPFDLDLEPGWTGVVGANGVGKTTLLRLLSGQLACARGSIRREHGPAIAVLEQTVDWSPALARQLARLEQDWSAKAGRLRSLLELGTLDPRRWNTLSPGERKRWQLAAALVDEPALLLCDEPGNHLDAAARDLLLAGLREFSGLGVLVSHDRELLDALCTATLFLDAGGRLELRRGGHAQAAAEREAERDHIRSRHALARKDERRQATQLQRARERQASTQRSLRVSSRKRDPQDNDASSMARKSRAERAAASAEAGVRRKRSALDRARASVEALAVEHPSSAELFVDWEPPRKSVLLTLGPEDLPRYAAHPRVRLPEDRALSIGREDRIVVTGNNGAGKSSLLRTIVARARACLDPARVLWLPQELDLDARRDLLVELAGLDTAARGRVLQIVGAAGGDPAALLRTPLPSPGEARKLALALGLARRAWLLVLDEPSNHLDLPAREAVEAMLASYPGALLLSSHDRRFVAGLSKTRWRAALTMADDPPPG